MGNSAPKPKSPFSYFNQFHGLNSKSQVFSVLPEQFRELSNVVFSKIAGFKSRAGTLNVNTNLPAGTPEIVIGLDFRRTVAGVTTQKKMCITSDGKVYNYSTDPPTLVFSGLAPGVQYDHMVVRGWYVFTDGTLFKKYNGTTVYDYGIQAPASAPTLALGGAGNPNGTYQFRVSYRRDGSGLDPGHVGSMGTVSATISPVNQQVNLTAIPVSGDPQVTSKDIQVLIPNTGLWFTFTNIPNATTVATYNLLDSAAVLLPQGFTDHDPPPAGCYLMEKHKDLVFLSDGKNLWWTPTDTFEAFSSFARQSHAFETDDGTLITGLRSMDDLVVTKQRSIFLRSGDDVNYSVQCKVRGHGFLARHSLVVDGGTLLGFANDGFRMFDGTNSQRISNNIDNLLFNDDLQKVLYSPEAPNIRGTIYSNNETRMILWTIPTAATVSAKIFTYFPEFITADVEEETVLSTLHQKYVGSWSIWDAVDARTIFTGLNLASSFDELFIGGRTGRLAQIDVGHTDNGAPINCVARSADLYMGEQLLSKRLRRAWFSYTTLGSGLPTIPPKVEWYRNGAATGVVKSLNALGTGGFFDSAIFDNAHFASIEGTIISLAGYSASPWNTLGVRLTWSVASADDDILWNGWVFQILSAGYRAEGA